MEIIALFVAAVFTNNFILVQTVGICPFLGVSKKTESALGMGVAVTFVMVLASLFTYAINTWVLATLKIEFMQTIVFIFVIASLVQMLEMILKKISPSLYASLGVYLPLITTNCAILGIAQANLTAVSNLFMAVLNGAFAGIGFTLAIFLMSGIREKLDKVDVPRPFKGFPITLITACFMAMAFGVFA
ncbi:MAG: RnfABCDGE type electron transport complex subunit A [Clostridiales bacterium]|nr:RnfABCDGE type electron transport complex subunit A [Clostridiales bacterium]